MSIFVLNTVFDLSENLIMTACDCFGSNFGILTVKDEKIKLSIDSTGKTKSFSDVNKFMKFVEDNKLTFKKLSVENGTRFIKYNPNPQKKNTGDCTIRAYTKAENITWEQAYDIAMRIGKKYAAIPDDSNVVDKILTEEFGYKRNKFDKPSKRLTVEEFAVTFNKGTYVLKLRNHLVTVENGFFYDSWNSGSKKVLAYYNK